MTENLCICTCQNFTHEISSAVTVEGWSDVSVVTFPAHCGRPPLAYDALKSLVPEGCQQLVVLGSSCLGALGELPPDAPATKIVKVAQCFHLIAGQQLVDETIASGGYLITPTWLAGWRKHLDEMGFGPENAGDFFHEFARELVLFDTGTDPECTSKFSEMSGAIRLNARRMPVGLDYVRPFLSSFVLAWRFEKEQRASKERERLNSIKLADQVTAMDMLMRLASIRNENKSVDAIKELFNMLFAPKALYYLKMNNGIPVADPSIPADVLAGMSGLHDDYALTPDGQGFLLRIKHGDDLLGCIAVDRLTFPEYRSRYLNMALAVTGVFALVVNNAREIAERLRAEKEKLLLEKQLIQTQKLESLGVLAGGIAHDFNNILAIIIGYCGLIKIDSELAGQTVPEIEKAAERAAGLCRQMLAYAGKAQLEKAQINMKTLVNEMVTMLKATLPQNALINTQFSHDIPDIVADATQIRQIVMNLIINASEAVGTEQGEIRVSLSNETATKERPVSDYIGTSIPPGDYLCLEVADNGCGMDEEAKWRIFEPFYTTKFTGRGLGMSAVLGIITSHKGALQLSSQLGEGTTFRIYLPALTSRTANDGPGQTVQAAPWRGSGTILLVEDEDQVRLIAKTLLTKIGFTVLEAANGREALEMYRKKGREIKLVVTDVGMPVMDGYELFYKLKHLSPKLPIILSSGFGDAEVSARIGSDNIAGLISKPYKFEQFREVLKSVFDGSP